MESYSHVAAFLVQTETTSHYRSSSSARRWCFNDAFNIWASIVRASVNSFQLYKARSTAVFLPRLAFDCPFISARYVPCKFAYIAVLHSWLGLHGVVWEILHMLLIGTITSKDVIHFATFPGFMRCTFFFLIRSSMVTR